MTETRRIATLVAATLLVAAGAGCAKDSTADPPSEPPASTSSSDATAPTTPPSESESAGQAAESVVRRHFEVLDRLRQDPKHPLKALAQVSVGAQLDAEKGLVGSERDKGYRQQGTTKVAVIKINSVNLDNSDPKAGKVPTVSVDVCWDVSAVDVVDAKGKSVVSEERPDRGWTRYSVSNYQWAEDPSGGWRIASGETLGMSPCAA